MIEEPVKYIKKVEIQGLFGRYDIEWNLHPDVNVLAGINGSGKTTILNAITTLAMWDWTLNLLGQPVVLARESHIHTSFSITFNNEYCISYDPYATRPKPLIPIYLIRTFDAEAKSQETLQKVDKQVKTELDLELWLMQKEYMKYQIRISKTNSDINRATHTRFLAIIDELFSETHKKINSDKEELEFLLDDKEINTYQLSSGEKQLLVILLTVLVQDNKPAILLMDEPEISLHIEWQRKLIKYIRELNPNAQIIIATHSPDIIIKGWLDKVVNIEDIIVKDNAVA